MPADRASLGLAGNKETNEVKNIELFRVAPISTKLGVMVEDVRAIILPTYRFRVSSNLAATSHRKFG